ncbi:hypothetical protein [Succiniclasticum ruminis]|uniref:DUF697 domain-containing protein n=1 Tax=Succiniclasticum ruminis DSM 9236 TaxID=1123323 RepID=A0A1I2A3U3_9FIRM|nr:hypothetical protein [Succiniclasticum ruminis]SFE38622.1 hypothetical protein SAMN05216245_10537 [Succiniclasticum ruminis DSM 9236]
MAEEEVKQTAQDEAAEKVTEEAAEASAAAENTEKTAAAGEAGKAEEAGAAEEAAKEETVAGGAEEKKEIEPLEDIDTEWEAEKLCRWGAARASVLVVAPVFGTMALIANEVYMITRLADLRGIKVSEGTALGLLGSLGATFIGQSVFTLLPIPAIQIPLAVSITYGVGKAANAWLKAGRPEDVASFREVFEKARKEGAENADTFSNMDCKDEPLGDESKKFDLNALKEKMKNVKGEDVFAGVKTTADKAESTISQKIKDFNDRIVNPLKTKSDRWISAQNWQQLSRGELVIPYTEIKAYMTKALAGSDFALLDIGYLAPDYLRMNLQHNTYGTLELKLSVLDFYVDQNEAVAHIKVEGFDIFNNDFASLVVNTVGDKLIVAIIDLIFDKVTIENKDVEVTYENGVIGLDFTKTLQESKIGKTRFLKKSVLDVLHLTNLSVMEEGLKVKASVKL